MVNLGVYPEDDTVTIYLSTSGTGGVEENFSATLEEADVLVHKDGSVMTLSASTITITNVATGLYKITIDLANDADFTTGSEYWVLLDPNTETLGGLAFSAVLGVFWIETTLEQSLGLMSAIHTSHTVGATGNDTSHVHLSGITSTIGDDEINGEILLLYDVDTTEYHYAVITDFANTGDLAAVASLQGGVLPFTPASGDSWWRVAPGVATRLATQAKTDVGDAVGDEVYEGSYTLRQLVRGFATILFGKVSGMNSNAPVFRDLADSKNRISATTDANGNRTAITVSDLD